MGDTFDKEKSVAVPIGSFTFMDAQIHHYAWAEGDTEFMVYGLGPFAVAYVNPADDPQNKK